VTAKAPIHREAAIRHRHRHRARGAAGADRGRAGERELRAQVRGRAQAENGLVCSSDSRCPLTCRRRCGWRPQILADVPEAAFRLLTRRPDILQAEALCYREREHRRRARAFFPTISLTGTLGTGSAALSGLFGAGSSFWSIIPSLTVPVFNAGSEAELDVVEDPEGHRHIAQYEKRSRRRSAEVANGLAARGTSTTGRSDPNATRRRKQRAFDLSTFRYETASTTSHGAHGADPALRRALTLVSTRRSAHEPRGSLLALAAAGIRTTGDEPRAATLLRWRTDAWLTISHGCARASLFSVECESPAEYSRPPAGCSGSGPCYGNGLLSLQGARGRAMHWPDTEES